MAGTTQHHPSHDHPLNLQQSLGEYEVHCHGCDRYTVDKYPFFKCLGKFCLFNLHKSCASLPQQISHSFHPQHPLTLLFRPPYARGFFQCDACLKSSKGFTFHCPDCNFDLDVCCSQLIPKERIHEEIGFDGKSHSWFICDMDEKFEGLCSACGLTVENPVYVCLEYKLLMHKSCTQLPNRIENPLHRRHSLLLNRWVPPELPGDGGSEFCSLCADPLDGSIGYTCHECNFKLDKKCVSLVVRTYEFHDHPLVLVPIPRRFSCYKCPCKDCVPMLHCIDDENCGFNLHLHCVPSLPRVVNSEGHIHHLTLTNTRIKDHDDEEGHEEFYCDECEELRLLPDPTYYCEECHYVAHVRCLISDEDLIALGNEYRELSASEGSMGSVTGEEECGCSDMARTELEKEIDFVRSEIQALTAKLEELKQKRARAAKLLAHYENQR